MKLRFFSPLLILAFFASCGGQPEITGEWVEPVPGMEDMKQGFKLDEGGVATSINMATLRYTGWRQDGDLLILTGESIGNHQTISFTDTMQICKHTKDSLVLKSGNSERIYTR